MCVVGVFLVVCGMVLRYFRGSTVLSASLSRDEESEVEQKNTRPNVAGGFSGEHFC